MPTTNPITVNYSDEKLRILVEEYITMQKSSFTFKGLCSYVLYWAKEENQTTTNGLYESNELQPSDRERLCRILERIKEEGRIAVISNARSEAAATCYDEVSFSIIAK